jgi:hypothetical protein
MKNLIKSLLILMPTLVSAQDVLYKTDNSKQEVKVTEINGTSVKYKEFNNPDGPLYIISKNEIALIIYQNGKHEVFNTVHTPVTYVDPSPKKLQRYEKVTANKNVIFLNTIEFLNSGIGVSYLHEFGDGKFDLHIPFATSFGSPGMDNALSSFGSLGSHKINKTNYDIGLGLYYNTGGKRSVTHFIGPLIRNAQYSGTYYSYNDYSYSAPAQKTFSMNETSLMLNNGFLYRITPRFNMMINIAMGTFIRRSFIKEPENNNYYQQTPMRSVALHAGFHFGYRF